MRAGHSNQNATWISNEINANLVYLTENLSNLHKILICLRQKDIISEEERQLIDSERTDGRKNYHLLYLIQKKDWANRKPVFLEILKISGNSHCAETIEKTPIALIETKRSNTLPSKWWPEKKTLPLAFQVRKSDNRLLTAQIKEILSQNESNKTTVITQKVTVSGLGGIGKTTTAIWFATQYENDYSHVIWIDCGDKSLLNSFKSLARDLDVKHLQDLEIKQLALGSFQILKDLKCLFISDNAECYLGKEGVKKVLPKFNENFDVLITSRNQKWGTATGDGEVPQFPMNLFDQQEGVEFMRNNIKCSSKNKESQLSLLCGLLGNLPLALQIAVATVNDEKIQLEEYIDRIKNTPEILNKKFDNYEETINKTLKISMDLIKAQVSDDERRIGEVAHQILTIFGYITPDNVPIEFFKGIEMFITIIDIDAAIKLLESYSLLSRKSKADNPPSKRIPCSNFSNEIIFARLQGTNSLHNSAIASGNVSDYQHTLSIHRLLQQVIRHNTEQSREKILTNILICKGFLDYKLIPFSFANEKLQNKFPKIKAELIDKLHIIELLRAERFSEAVELSRVIANTLKNPVSKFNFAVCLKQNSEFKESEVVFNGVLSMISYPATESTWGLFKWFLNLRSNATDDNGDDCFTQWGTITSSTNLTNEVVLGQLFSIHLLENNIEKARDLVLSIKQLILPIIPLNDILTCLCSIPLTTMLLNFHKDKHYITLKSTVGNAIEQKMQMYSWVINDHIIMISDELHLTLENTTISAFASIKLDIVKGSCVHMDDLSKANWIVNKLFLQNVQFTQKTEMTITELEVTHSSVDITILPKSLRKLKLNECFLINCLEPVDKNPMPVLLQELSFINVYVEGKHGEQCTPFEISHFISPKLNKLKVVDFGCGCFCLQLSMKVLTSLKSLHLERCCLEFLPNILLIPTELTLNIVRIVDSHNFATNAIVNHFVDMSKLQLLCLTGMTIDFSIAVDLRELTLINAKLLNWDNGCWSIQKLNAHPNPGSTQMKIGAYQNLLDPENVANTSSIVIKKEKLLKFLKSISGSRTISGLDIANKKRIANDEIQRITGMLPGILNTMMPKYSAGVNEWQSFVEKSISDWNNHYLVHIRCYWDGNPLTDILEDRNETSWNDLIEEKGERNKLWKKSLDTLAPFLLQLQTAGVVPILDILPYINYKDYVWGGRGGLEGSLKLFQITKDYLTQHHGLTSLIWNWSLTPRGDMTRLEDYWPGNNYVDIASVYMVGRKELRSTEYQKLLDVVGDKPIAMEYMWSVPSTELLATQTRWTWFTADDRLLTDEMWNSSENTKRTFESPSVMNRGTNPFFNSRLST